MPSSPTQLRFDAAVVEHYEYIAADVVRRIVRRRDGSSVSSELPIDLGRSLPADAAFDLAWLRGATSVAADEPQRVVRSVDLFAGCGGLSLGLSEACRALGLELESVLANDISDEILGIYARNFPEAEIVCAPVETVFDGPIGSTPTPTERRLADRLGHIDLVIGGPPCQGHSDFNNHTRNDDPKNGLYLRMARFCEVVRPPHVIIENVPGVERDKGRVAQRTWEHLRELGYSVSSGVIDTSKVGVAQRRKRSITIASLEVEPSIEAAISDSTVEDRPLSWAIEDLLDVKREALIDQPPSPNSTTARRIDYLFENGLHELPDHQRPDCHRLKDHSYVSVYGRLYWDRPAPTITTGFGVMGRGRFVHPSQRRTITPHEAARIQFFPDNFDFGPGPRTLLHTVIGNAVPPKLGYVLGLHLLR